MRLFSCYTHPPIKSALSLFARLDAASCPSDTMGAMKTNYVAEGDNLELLKAVPTGEVSLIYAAPSPVQHRARFPL